MINGWKVTAIIFIVLFVSLVGLIIFASFSVVQDEERESQCINNICLEEPYYRYYKDEQVCECYDDDYELSKQEYIK